MRRRETPYSRLAEIRASRTELLALVLTTLALGLTLSLVSDALYEGLRGQNIAWLWILALGLAATLILTLFAVWFFYSHAESQRVRLEMWLPYHLPDGKGVTIARSHGYQVPRHARRAWMRRYPANAPITQAWLTGWQEAKEAGKFFQVFAHDDHVALSQCLLLYALHRAGEEILGPEASYDWWEVNLPDHRWTLDDLPPPLRDNPFLRAEQKPDEWRLLLPQHVTLSLENEADNPWPRWVLRHRYYGRVEFCWIPHVVVAGRGSQVWHILTQNLRLSRRSELYVLNARLEGQARFRWTLLSRSDPFHRWATSLLARLEEALDWAYFLETRPARILADLDWKIGWWERDDSLVDALARLERRLDDLIMDSLEAEPEEAADA